ncbi:MAG: hypothetical protein HUU02_02190 [Bacteroidetes bacterium]|nr:hypothetical protein [Bacteroidota bacterium]
MNKAKIIVILVCIQCILYGCDSTNESNEQRESILHQLYPNVSVSKIAIVPNGNIIAVVEKGVMRSIDKGKSWQYCINDYPHGRIIFSNDGYVYIPTLSGMYSSSNYGSSWSFTDSIAKFTDGNLVLAKSLGSMVVTSNNYVFGTSSNGVLCSTNRGKNWFEPDTSFHISYIEDICQIHDTLFVSGIFGVLRSTNYGLSWDTLAAVDAWIAELYTDSLNNIYVSNIFGSTYRSSDRGISWHNVYKGFLAGFTVGKNNVLFAVDRNLLKSSDNGLTWIEIVSATDLGVTANSTAIDDEGYLYVGASMRGIYKSKTSFY